MESIVDLQNKHLSIPSPHVPFYQGWVNLHWDYQIYQDLPNPSARTTIEVEITHVDIMCGGSFMYIPEGFVAYQE